MNPQNIALAHMSAEVVDELAKLREKLDNKEALLNPREFNADLVDVLGAAFAGIALVMSGAVNVLDEADVEALIAAGVDEVSDGE